MSFTRAVSSLGCAELSLPDVFALAKRHGLDAVELRALGSTLDLPDYLRRNFGTPEALAEWVRGSAVRIAAFDTSLRLTGHTPADREKFLEFVPWAEALGVPWLRVFDGENTSASPGTEEAASSLRWWRDLRRAHDWHVDCMVETHDSLLDAARILRFLAAAPGTAILWDTHHTWKLGGEDPIVSWRAIGAHVVYLHVKDSIDDPTDHHPYTYVLPGHGGFPMASLARVLREEFHGTVSLEWEHLWHPYLPPLEAALRSSAATAWW